MKNNRKNGNSFYNLQSMHTMCPPFQVLLTLHHFSLCLAVMLLLQRLYPCSFQFIHCHQITMQNTSLQDSKLLIKILLRSKQISIINGMIFMTRKLVSFPSQMVRWFMFVKNHHHIYQAVPHVLSGILWPIFSHWPSLPMNRSTHSQAYSFRRNTASSY